MSNLNETAHKILDAAERFTQTEGFNAFSYKDLQAEVGVKTSSIHYYFPTKQDLAAAMAERYRERFNDALADINSKNSKAVDRIKAFGQLFVDTANADKLCLCGMLTSDALSLSAKGVNDLRLFFKDSEKWVARNIQLGIEEGQFKPSLKVEDAAAHLLATLQGALLIARTRKDAGYTKAVLEQVIFFLTEK